MSIEEIAQELITRLSLETYPIGVKLIEVGQPIPSGLRSSRELGFEPIICQIFGICRLYGWSLYLDGKECRCPLASCIYGWVPWNRNTLIEFMLEAGYAMDRAIAQAILSYMEQHCRLELGKIQGVGTTPLTGPRFESQIALIYCTPAQAYLLGLGLNVATGMPLDLSSTGRHGSCGHGVISAYLTDQPRLVLPCGGDRVFGGVQDHELAIALPIRYLNSILNGIRLLESKRIMRMPIPRYLRFKAEFPDVYRKLGTKLGISM